MYNLYLPTNELTPLADQYEAASADARRLAPDNRSLMMGGNTWVEDVMVALTGPTDLGDWDDGLLPAPEPVVVVVADADYALNAHRVPTDGGPVTRSAAAQCSRCDWHEVHRVAAWYDTLWIAKGMTIVELVVCHLCAMDLKRQCSDIVFKSGHDAVQR